MNTARFNIQLVPRDKRQLSAPEIAQRLRPQLSRFPGVQAFVTVPPAIQIGGQMNNSSYGLTVQSLDNDELYTWAPRLEAAMAQLPDVQDVNDNMQMKSPLVNLIIDRDKAAADRLERHADREHAVGRLRPEVVVDDLRHAEPAQGDPRARSAATRSAPTR